LDVTSQLDPSRHAKQYKRHVVSNEVMAFLSIIVPSLIALFSPLIKPDVEGVRITVFFLSRFGLVAMIGQIIKLVTSSPRPNALHLEKDKLFNNSNFESRQSFFSAHSAACVFSSWFVKSFLEKSFPVLLENHSIIKVCVSYILPILGLYPGYTQWKQNWHHLHDVLFGYAYGFITYLLVFSYKNDCILRP
jgi:hypothetical protein